MRVLLLRGSVLLAVFLLGGCSSSTPMDRSGAGDADADSYPVSVATSHLGLTGDAFVFVRGLNSADDLKEVESAHPNLDKTAVVIRGKVSAAQSIKVGVAHALTNLPVEFCMNMRLLSSSPSDPAAPGEYRWYYHCFVNANQPDFFITFDALDLDGSGSVSVRWDGLLRFPHPDNPLLTVNLHESSGGVIAVAGGH